MSAATSKELLDRPPKPSLLETLLLGNKDSVPKPQQNKLRAFENEEGRPVTTEVTKSQVLGKVKDFLGVMAKANEKLELNAQGDSRSNYDIEVLNENEEEYIEMDLLLGVADLRTAEAVAAAEATMGGFQPSISAASSSSSYETEDDSDDDNDSGNSTIAPCHQEKPSSVKDHTCNNKPNKLNKRPKIVVLN